jgi:hypothetical protein
MVILLGLCVAVPAARSTLWFVKATLDAGTGSACPACAVDDYFAYGPLGTLGGDDVAFTPTLCHSNRAQLHEQAVRFAQRYKDAARKWSVSPELSDGAMDGDKNVRDGKAAITVAVTHFAERAGRQGNRPPSSDVAFRSGR